MGEFGVAVDLAIHEPDDKHRDEDLLNYHCHLLTTTRIALPEGLGDKTRDLDRLNTSGPLVESMREWWARTCNAFLEAAAALDRTPTEHKGPTRTYAHTDERAAEVVEERAAQAEQVDVVLVRAQEAAERAAALLGAWRPPRALYEPRSDAQIRPNRLLSRFVLRNVTGASHSRATRSMSKGRFRLGRRPPRLLNMSV